jgi:glycosyltransferase involved in cell wall biosynthesis
MDMMEATARPLRVIHVTWGLNVGGLEKLLVEFARHADRRRVDLRFVSLSARGQLAGAIESCGWPVTAMEEPEGLRPGLAFRLALLFRRWRADVVHTHNTKALVYGGPAARLARVRRLIHTWHGQNLVGSRREELLFRLLGRLPDWVVAVSRDAEQLMIKEGIPANRVRTIWNGIDTRRFAFAGAQPHGPVVTVARLSPEKDVQTLLRAMPLVKQQEPGIHLEIAGEGACLPELERLRTELGLNGDVRFLGQVQEVPSLLGRAGLFVLPSLTEGISLTLLEASACGLPVVATNVGGNPEVVENGVSGLLVPTRSPEKMAEAIVQLYRDPARRRQMGQAARQRVEDHFDIRQMVAAYEDLYEHGLPSRLASASGPIRMPKPRVISNLSSLAEQRELVRCDTIPKQGAFRTAVRLWLRSFNKDAIVLNQESQVLGWLCLFRLLLPFPQPPLVSLDLVLARPGNTLVSQIKGILKRMVFTQVDLFLMHLKERQALKEVFGIAPQKVVYIPFKVNFLEAIANRQPQEGDYIFTGGRSRRDYKTFCEALAGLDYPGLIVTPGAEENAEHGTSLEGVTLPSNVQMIHDDGSMESWIDKIANAKLAVFCISPETISPSGVGAYLLAMALKKCVIISDCPSTRDILIPDETSILVPMRDPVKLREAIRRACEDDDYRQRIAAGGYRYARSLGGEETLMRNVALAVVEYLRKRREKN